MDASAVTAKRGASSMICEVPVSGPDDNNNAGTNANVSGPSDAAASKKQKPGLAGFYL